MQPRISVIIPAYNEEKEIGGCLTAVLQQSFPKDQYEIIVVDNNSTDKTAEIVRAKGIQPFSYTMQQGFSVAKAEGVLRAKGEILAFTDADSTPDYKWLEIANTLLNDPKLVCVGGTLMPNRGGRSMKFLFNLYDLFAVCNQSLGIPMLWSPNMVVRRSAYDKINGFDPRKKTSDDWDLVLRLQKQFGRKSVIYTRKLLVTTSPRKQKNIVAFIHYIFIALINYVIIFLFRRSYSVGNPIVIR